MGFPFVLHNMLLKTDKMDEWREDSKYADCSSNDLAWTDKPCRRLLFLFNKDYGIFKENKI